MRTRLYGGVAGEDREVPPMPIFPVPQPVTNFLRGATNTIYLKLGSWNIRGTTTT